VSEKGVIAMENNHKPDDDNYYAIMNRIPPECRFLFGRVPVVSSESKSSYLNLVVDVAATIGPDDII
jgi:hypothetical protein